MKKLAFVLVLSALLAHNAQAEEPVFFEDPNLKTAVEEALWVSDPTPTDILGLTSLSAGDMKIKSLVGMEYAQNLRDLYLRFNDIHDISPLSGLTNLESIVLHRNWLMDLSPLSGLTKLVHLDLNDTHTSDISALAPLTGLENLILYDNDISDISVLTTFTSLTDLDLRLNLLSDETYEVHIPQIIANNPGVTILHDRGPYTLTLSSTRGGSVTYPGEGTFVYNDGRAVFIEAQADPGFKFVNFSGTLNTQQNPVALNMVCDYQMQAVFESVLDTVYVDDDAPNDLAQGNAEISDPQENGTREHPYDQIQEAVEVAASGATVRVLAGTYRENILISGKSIRILGREPNDPNGTPLPVIRGDKSGAVVFIGGAGDSYCTFTGFAITGGKGQAGIIHCSSGASTISHCLIAGNRPTGSGGALMQCTDSDIAIINCTIADNYMDACNAGLRVCNSMVTLTNSILYHNTSKCSNAASLLYTESDAEVFISHSDIEGGWSGNGNIDLDPSFACRGRWTDDDDPLVSRDPSDSSAVLLVGDYHLLSGAGRWDESTSSWLCDDAISPCIDAGDPTGEIGYEPAPNGGIVNMGVYGGTSEASRSDASGSSP